MGGPSPNGAIGRDGRGRFAAGNAGGPGNPYAKRVGKLRAAMMEAVTPEDVRAIVAAMVAKAKAGDIVAAREVLLRVLGRPMESDLIERLETVEERDITVTVPRVHRI